jgi:hypothetical protein
MTSEVPSPIADSERPLPPLLRLVRRAWILGDRSHSASRTACTDRKRVRCGFGLGLSAGALSPAVGNDLCPLTWCAALTLGYAATCRFACIFR